MKTHFDHLVVGAGPAGCAIARTLLDAGKSVLIVDNKQYIGGYTADVYDDEANCMVQVHGPQEFHTFDDDIFNFMSRFTKWKFYTHEVLAKIGNIYMPMPVNYRTIACVKGHQDFSPDVVEDNHVFETHEWMKIYEEPSNAYEQSLIKFGKAVTEAIIAPHAYKMWGIDLANIDASYTATANFLPSWNEVEPYIQGSPLQFQPRSGFTVTFEKMIEGATVLLGVKYSDIIDQFTFSGKKFWTEPLDHLVGDNLLVWRCAHYKFEKTDDFQPVPIVMTPSQKCKTIKMADMAQIAGRQNNIRTRYTIIANETMSFNGSPTYSMPLWIEKVKANKVKEIIANEFGDWCPAGRLGLYHNMAIDQDVQSGIKAAKEALLLS